MFQQEGFVNTRILGSSAFERTPLVIRNELETKMLEILQIENSKERFASILLIGQSGSGKTSVSMKLANELVANDWNVLYLDLEATQTNLRDSAICDFSLGLTRDTVFILDTINNNISEVYMLLNCIHQNIKSNPDLQCKIRFLLTCRMEPSSSNPLWKRLDCLRGLTRSLTVFLDEKFALQLAREYFPDSDLNSKNIQLILGGESNSIPKFIANLRFRYLQDDAEIKELFQLELSNILAPFDFDFHLRNTAASAVLLLSVFTKMHCFVCYNFLYKFLNASKLSGIDTVLDKLITFGHLRMHSFKQDLLLGLDHPEIAEGIIQQNSSLLLSLTDSVSMQQFEEKIWLDYIENASDDIALFLVGLCDSLEEQERYEIAESILSAIEKLPRKIPELSSGLSNLAILLSSINLIEKAESALNLALSVNPFDVVALVNYGAFLYGSGNNEEALKMLEHAIRIDSSLVVAHLNIAIIKDALGQREESLSILRFCVELAPDEPYVLMQYGLMLLKNEQLDDAISVLTKVTQISPDWVTAKLILAEILLQTGVKKEATRIIVQISRSDGLDQTEYILLGRLLQFLSKYNKAEEFAIKALELNPSMVEGWLLLAESFESRNSLMNFKEAYSNRKIEPEGEADKLVSLANLLEILSLSDEANSVYNTALVALKSSELDDVASFLVYTALGMKNQAMDVLESSRNSKQEMFERLANRAMIQLESENSQYAELTVNLLVEFFPSSEISWRLRGDLLGALGKPVESIQAYTKAITINPCYSDALVCLANRYHETGNLNKTLEFIKQAIECIEHSDYPEYAWNTLGTLYSEMKMYFQSEEALKKAISINPNFPIARRNLAILYTQLGEHTKAERQYELSKSGWSNLRGQISIRNRYRVKDHLRFFAH